MSDEIKIFTIDPKAFFEAGLESGDIKALPRSGKCMFCGNQLTSEDTDHSVCNKCWTDTFACKQCGDETGECEHIE